jgi:predicted RNase H-like HicB family nuclease
MSRMRETTEARRFENASSDWQAVALSSGFTFINSVTSGPYLENKIEPGTVRHIEQRVFDKYVHGAMKIATFERMEDGSYFSEIPGFPGVWASGESLKDSLVTLEEVLGEWLLLKIKDHDQDIPVIEDINLNII